jgi:CRP-like cAMP-binding protein/ABC-type iron transport system FetAB ATPase subunit
LEARRAFAEGLPDDLKPAVQFFHRDTYNAASSIQDNILFGKMASEKAQSGARVGKLIADVIDELDLRRTVIEVGLDYQVGIGGTRLAPAQRQKLALARCLLKRPDVVIINEALSSLDKDSRDAIFAKVKEDARERSLIWVDSQEGAEGGDRFQHVFAAESGRIVPLGEAAPAERPEATEALDEATPAASGLGAEVEVLAKIPLFAGMDRSKLKFLAFTSERLSFDAGEILFRQGEVGDKAYIIVEGTAEVILETDGGDKRLAMIGKNELFGELALLCDAPRTATVRAETPLTVLGISKDLFVRLIEDDAEISANVSRAIAARLEGTLREYGKSNTMYDAETKLATYSLLDDRFKRARAQKKRHGGQSAILTFDFDHLRDMGNGINRDSRAEILRQAGERIRACLRELDTVAFLQESEFAILVNEIESDTDPAHVARRLAEALAKPFTVGTQEITLGNIFRFNLNEFGDEDLDSVLDLCRQGKSKSLTVEL